MARPLRIEYPNAVHHVTSRGNRRETIFVNDDERYLFYDVLTSVVRDYNWICHADCQMGNHYHHVIETPEANLSAGMRQLNGVFTQRLNKLRGTVGHVFQGRFASRVINTDEYFLEACRYTVLNPVRAGIAAKPGDWKWSSYLASAGLVTPRPFLSLGRVWSYFRINKKISTAEYREFISAGIGLPSPFASTPSPFLGSEEFAADILEQQSLSISGEVPRKARLAGRPPLADVLRRAGSSRKERNLAIVAAWKLHAYSMIDIARALGLHYATVSKILKREASR